MDPNHEMRNPQSAQAAPRELGQISHHGQLSGGARTPLGQRQNQGIPKWILVGILLILAGLPYLVFGGKAPDGFILVLTFVVPGLFLLLGAFCNNLFKGGN